MTLLRKGIAVFLSVLSLLFGSAPAAEADPAPAARRAYTGEYSAVNGAYAGTDALGREIDTAAKAEPLSGNRTKSVGVFYFLWLGEHGTDGPYDNHRIAQAHPEAAGSAALWDQYGGGVDAFHFWGEPLWGYYVMRDKWVLSRHAQLLTDAGVDYIVCDVTNAFVYLDRVYDLIDVWYGYLEAGCKVPQIAFYTASGAVETAEKLYDAVYCSAELKAKYPRLEELFFRWNGKPLLISETEGQTQELLDFFTIKNAQWPNREKNENGWPWMEFDRACTPASVYHESDGQRSVISVSAAQHSDTVIFSRTEWYGGNDRTRSWHDGENDPAPDAVLYGFNFQEQWDYAIAQDTQTIFVTGWNEWGAERLSEETVEKLFGPDYPEDPVYFCDNCGWNTSRDLEPMKGGFGDNYYMQLAENIVRYKGAAPRVDVGDPVTIDINGSFEQWNSERITAVYTDYRNDTADRDCSGFGGEYYRDCSGRNDFTVLKTAHDGENLYFYAETARDITGEWGDNKLVLFINTNEGNSSWEHYDYAVNLAGKGKLSRCLGGWSWDETAEVEVKTEGNTVMLKLPYAALGIDGYNDGLIDLRFKWADNFKADENGEYTAYAFYRSGDAAPLGRFDYVYSNVAK